MDWESMVGGTTFAAATSRYIEALDAALDELEALADVAGAAGEELDAAAVVKVGAELVLLALRIADVFEGLRAVSL